MTPDRKLITVNGPVVDLKYLHTATTGIIYSVSMANGMVVTSPERFERATNPPTQDARQENK